MHFSSVNNKKITCVVTETHDLWTAENRECFVNDIVYSLPNLTFFRKLIKYFMYFRMKFALFFRFFYSWYTIKYLLTETSAKQYVFWTLNCRHHRQVHKTYCLTLSQSIKSVDPWGGGGGDEGTRPPIFRFTNLSLEYV